MARIGGLKRFKQGQKLNLQRLRRQSLNRQPVLSYWQATHQVLLIQTKLFHQILSNHFLFYVILLIML